MIQLYKLKYFLINKHRFFLLNLKLTIIITILVIYWLKLGIISRLILIKYTVLNIKLFNFKSL